MHLTFRQMQVFEAVVRYQGVTAAARELHCTQPSVSIQLRQLAAQVGMPLFDHSLGRLTLTDAGEALYRACQEVQDALKDFETSIGNLQGLQRGRLRIGVVSTAKYFMPRLLGPFCQRYPDIEVGLEVSNRERIVARLRDGLDDLSFMSRPPEDIDLEVRPFLDNPLVLIAPADSPLAGRPLPGIEALAGERMLLREPGSGTRIAVDDFLAGKKIRLGVRMEIGSNEAIKQAVAGGLGLSIISRHAIRDMPGIVELNCDGFPIMSTWKIVRPAKRPLSLIAARFIDYLLLEGLQQINT